MSTSKTLRKAADIMITGGYIKGRTHSEKGAHCALGAIQDASVMWWRRGCDSKFNDAIQSLGDMISDKFPPEGVFDTYNRVHVTKLSLPQSKIAAWNNMLCNSAEEVACMMRATAEFEEEESGVPSKA